MQSEIIILPTFIIMGMNKIKKYHLNFNNYHTWHYQVRNKLKSIFQTTIMPQINDLPKMDTIGLISYNIYHKTNRKFDVCNKLSLLDKYLQDALVIANVIEDDNYEFIKDVEFHYGGKKDGDYATAKIFYT